MSGEGKIGEDEVLEKSVFVKAVDWSYERERRIAGGGDKTEQTEDIPFYAEEVTAIYLGCRISDENAGQIRDIIDNKYPHASIHAGKNRSGGLLLILRQSID